MMGAGNGTGLAVVAQPRPTVVQQKSFCAWDHEFSIIAALPKPASQSNGRDEDEPDSSQQTKKATTCDDASEVPLGASEVAATSDVLVCRFL